MTIAFRIVAVPINEVSNSEVFTGLRAQRIDDNTTLVFVSDSIEIPEDEQRTEIELEAIINNKKWKTISSHPLKPPRISIRAFDGTSIIEADSVDT